MSYQYDPSNIALTLQRAIAQGASYEEVDRLLTARNRKIERGGEAMAQYKNDDLTRDAEAYLASRRSHPNVDLDTFREAREQAAAENLQIAGRAHLRDYEQGVAAAQAEAAAQKKALHADYRRGSLLGEEALAANGLGKGSGAPSSGYGESARTAVYLDYQNALGQVREQESKQKSDLYADYLDRRDESLSTYTDKRDEITKDYADKSVEQQNKDREYLLEESKHNADVNQWNQEFDFEVGQAIQEDRTEAQQSKYDRALEAFKQTGEIASEGQAEILGLPVGTKTLERTEFENDSAHMWSVYTREDEWHAQEMAYKNATLSQKRSSAAAKVSNTAFENNYDLFKAVGEVLTQEMSDVLGLPMGTKYWEYVESTTEQARKQQELDFEMGEWEFKGAN